MVKNITGEIKKHITGHDESWYSRVWEAGQALPTSAVTADDTYFWCTLRDV